MYPAERVQTNLRKGVLEWCALAVIGRGDVYGRDLARTLTDLGLAAARDIVARHDALCDFFITVLGVDAGEADQAACRMEHTVPKTIVERLVRYADYVKHCPRGGITWDSGFGYYCKHGCTDQDCSRNLPGADEPGR